VFLVGNESFCFCVNDPEQGKANDAKRAIDQAPAKRNAAEITGHKGERQDKGASNQPN